MPALLTTVSGGDLFPTVSCGDITAVQTVCSDVLNAVNETNGFLLELNERVAFLVSVVVAIAFVAVCYIILKSFMRF